MQIRYRGAPIDREALLRYVISFRQHAEFHEHCVERIYTDIMAACRPELLTVYARYTRRGGLDINPWRSNFEAARRPTCARCANKANRRRARPAECGGAAIEDCARLARPYFVNGCGRGVSSADGGRIGY